jgi:hypothetical protein
MLQTKLRVLREVGHGLRSLVNVLHALQKGLQLTITFCLVVHPVVGAIVPLTPSLPTFARHVASGQFAEP